ncbi:MAG: efflux RND transporter periplasmic adaptor subunit [Phycisphaerales bacterium]|nr:efflux RND transporter periplasmic adaptor subunit [Phycisphaerales bacterium]
MPQNLIEPIIQFGTTRADRLAPLSAQVIGQVIELPAAIRPGRTVAKDQILLRIDAREYEAALAQAEGQLARDRAALAQLDVEESNLTQLISTAVNVLDNTQWDFNKTKALFDQQMASDREFKTALIDLERARLTVQEYEHRKALIPAQREQQAAVVRASEATVDLARLNVEHCTIKAPFDGVIEELSVALGQRVQIGESLFTLLDSRWIEVVIEVPAGLSDRVRVGAPCRLTVETMHGSAWDGLVKRISPAANEMLRTLKVYVEVDNDRYERKLLPGFFVKARIDGPTLENVLTVPRNIIQNNRVFVYNDGHAHVREVRVEHDLLDRSVVIGLEPGDIVITSHLDSLYDNAPVSIIGDLSASAVPNERHEVESSLANIP